MTPQLRFREVTPETWPDLERLFEGRGGPKYCWCMVWRDMPAEDRRSGGGPARKRSLESAVKSGMPVGIVGYMDGEPVAWCSIAPRPTYRKGLGGVDVEGQDPGAVWSLACFFIQRQLRGDGLARQVLEAAVEHARMNGAASVEAYPVDPDSPSYRYMGFVEMFAGRGFRELGRAGSRRHVMRIDL